MQPKAISPSFLNILFVVGALLAAVTLSLSKVVAQMPPSTATPSTMFIIAKDYRGFEMVQVPGGKFEMGISRDALYKVCTTGAHGIKETNCDRLVDIIGEEEGIFQTHIVELPAFWIDRYEVTIEQYQVCVGSDRGGICQPIDLSYQPNLIDNAQKPQVGVNWYAAVYFCNTRSARLPTEAEWEYAAKGPKGFVFPWGNTFVHEYAGPTGRTYPVGTISGNRSWAGVFDLSGNAAEWVEDLFKPYVDASNGLPEFPRSDTDRVARGGSWANRSFALTTFNREFFNPKGANFTVGFRCARSTDPRQ